jgi:hypothetical protein
MPIFLDPKDEVSVPQLRTLQADLFAERISKHHDLE